MTNPYSTVYRDYEHVPPQSPPAAEATPKGPALGAPSQPPPAVKGKKVRQARGGKRDLKGQLDLRGRRENRVRLAISEFVP